MAHEWHAGVLSKSSWHGLETVENIPNVDTLIRRGEELGAWPVAIDSTDSFGGARVASGQALVGRYADGSSTILGTVSKGYQHLTTERWRELVRAAGDAGARPTGAFALRGGAKLLATFEVGESNGIRTQFCLADSFDRSTSVLAGLSSVRVVCANTLAAAMDFDGHTWGRVQHNANLPERTQALGEAIDVVVRKGGEVRAAYDAARERQLREAEYEAVMSVLFPVPAIGTNAKPAELAARTRAQNARTQADRAASRSENNDGGRTLATAWNAATWCIDRDAAGNAKKCASPLESMLFGSRGRRVEEVRALIEVVLRDGTTTLMEANEAHHVHGIDHAQIGRSLLEDMLAA